MIEIDKCAMHRNSHTKRYQIDFYTQKLVIRNCFEHYHRNARIVPFHPSTAPQNSNGWMDNKILRLRAIYSSRCDIVSFSKHPLLCCRCVPY